MLPIDPADGPAQAVAAQAIAHGGTIIRPGAVAWGGSRDAQDGGYSSCEAIERTLAEVTRDVRRFPGLFTELASARLWVPLPVRRRPFTDGAAVRLPVIGLGRTDFVPCFTSVQRLTAWAEPIRAADAGVVPHLVVPAAGLAQRLPSGLGLAINPGSVPGLPLYPECVPYLGRLGSFVRQGTKRNGPFVPPQDRRAEEKATQDWPQPLASMPGGPVSLAPPPAEPSALLAEVCRALRAVPAAAEASRALLSVPGRGEGLVIAVMLDDPASEPARRDVVAALERAVAAVPLRVPFPVDVTFPGEPVPGEPVGGEPFAGEPVGGEPGPDVIADWMARNTRPFYTRDLPVSHKLSTTLHSR